MGGATWVFRVPAGTRELLAIIFLGGIAFGMTSVRLKSDPSACRHLKWERKCVVPYYVYEMREKLYVLSSSMKPKPVLSWRWSMYESPLMIIIFGQSYGYCIWR
jgi:hypothetical protein